MAFVVEDGTGLTNSNAYCSVSFATTYHKDRGNTAWAGAEGNSARERAIVRASDYMNSRFIWRGMRLSELQAMEWPRIDAYYDDGRTAFDVPIEVQKACAEYALRALSSALAPDPVVDASGRPVTASTDKVGPIEKTREYGGGGYATPFAKTYPSVDGLLRELIRNGQTLERA